jgi:hypothetical protein
MVKLLLCELLGLACHYVYNTSKFILWRLRERALLTSYYHQCNLPIQQIVTTKITQGFLIRGIRTRLGDY